MVDRPQDKFKLGQWVRCISTYEGWPEYYGIHRDGLYQVQEPIGEDQRITAPWCWLTCTGSHSNNVKVTGLKEDCFVLVDEPARLAEPLFSLNELEQAQRLIEEMDHG